MISEEQRILVIAGPTASGKTSLAINKAQQTGAAVLSADSRMVYQGLDIGTSKPTWEYRQLDHSPWLKPRFITTSEVTSSARGGTFPFFGISSDGGSPKAKLLLGGGEKREGSDDNKGLGPIYSIHGIDHYLLDLVPAETSFTLADWLRSARAVLVYLQKKNQPAIVVGGTGLYLKALIEGYEPPPTNPVVRADIEQLETGQIIEELQKHDPAVTQREQANRRRLIRALEVVRLIGRPFSRAHRGQPLPVEFQIIKLPRTELYVRIDQRIQERIEVGMIEEIEGLLERGISQTWLSRLGLEYRVCTEWILNGNKNRGELVTRLQKEIHAYARRQETFIRTQLP